MKISLREVAKQIRTVDHCVFVLKSLFSYIGKKQRIHLN